MGKEMRGDGIRMKTLNLFYLCTTTKIFSHLPTKESKIVVILGLAKSLKPFHNILIIEVQPNAEAITKR